MNIETMTPMQIQDFLMAKVDRFKLANEADEGPNAEYAAGRIREFEMAVVGATDLIEVLSDIY